LSTFFFEFWAFIASPPPALSGLGVRVAIRGFSSRCGRLRPSSSHCSCNRPLLSSSRCGMPASSVIPSFCAQSPYAIFSVIPFFPRVPDSPPGSVSKQGTNRARQPTRSVSKLTCQTAHRERLETRTNRARQPTRGVSKLTCQTARREGRLETRNGARQPTRGVSKLTGQPARRGASRNPRARQPARGAS